MTQSVDDSDPCSAKPCAASQSRQTRRVIRRPTTSEIAHWNNLLLESGFIDIDSYDRYGNQTAEIRPPSKDRNACTPETFEAYRKYLRSGIFDTAIQKEIFRLYVAGHTIEQIAAIKGMRAKQTYNLVLHYRKACALKYGLSQTHLSHDRS